jgi:hypothetical protein
MNCLYCNKPVAPERVELGKNYCMSEDCIAQNIRDWAADYRIMLVPKQGFTLVHKSDPALRGGKSSGRS